jgi:hypothetical protein
MRLIKHARPFPVATQTRDGERYEDYHPRLAAIRHLRELVADGRAGVDNYDATIVIVDAHEHERVWTARACELTGIVIGIHVLADGGRRFRVVLEADVREELGLDRPDAPMMDENPATPVLRAVADARDAQTRMLEGGRS